MILALILSGALFLAGCAKKIDQEKVKASAKELDEKFMAAFNKEDINGVMDCYWNSSEVIFYPPDVMESKGYEAIKAEFEKFFAENEIKGLQLTDAGYMALGEYGLSWGNFSITLGTPDGGETKMEGRFNSVCAQKDGKWVYILDHASAPLPPPPTMEQMHQMMQEMTKKPMKK
ncbi:MAG TPA: nuclear transport factor 2 family protein [candidate division Zixibacteria bacterium]|nr:nuclear transport factor 2 family protein [candidate division Zixibacteria bacterium]